MANTQKLEELAKYMLIKPKNCINALKELHTIIKEASPYFLENSKEFVCGMLYPYIREPDNFRNEIKVEIINILMEVFKKSRTKTVRLYFNVSAFLLDEIYDPHEKNFVKNVYEEYKLSVVTCLIELNKSVSMDILLDIYIKEYTPRFSPIVYIIMGLARLEKLKSLRIAAIECLMVLARVDTDNYISDIVLCSQVAGVFMFFLPGVSTGLSKICLEDEKVGHKIIKTAVKAWGRIVCALMKDYRPEDKKINFNDIETLLSNFKTHSSKENVDKWKNNEEIQEYIKNSSRSMRWYKETDPKLCQVVDLVKNLCSHSHWAVRSELANVSLLLLEHCSSTMPKCLSKIVEILMTLSEDDNEKISKKCRKGLENLSDKLSLNYFTNLLDSLEENFFNLLSLFPHIFNGLDDNKKQTSLNLLISYMRLFGKYELISVLHSPVSLRRLLDSLLYICELETKNIQLLEEWTIQDFNADPDLRTPWKSFKHFESVNLLSKLTQLCELLSEDIIVDVVTDCLSYVFINDIERRKEATILLNEISSAKSKNQDVERLKTVIGRYLEPIFWSIPTSVNNNTNLSQVQNNVIQLCLQLEGIGKISLLLQGNFRDFLLKTLYPVIEKAASAQPLVKAAGLSTITNISIACKYSSVTDLINKNSDYFSYHVTRKLKKLEKQDHVLNVLGLVMNHCSMDVLPSITNIVEDILFESRDCSNKNITAFLKVFNIFTKCLLRWLNIEIKLQPIKSKAEKEKELKAELHTESEDNDFSDNVMGKTPEEMYEEDMKKKKEELEEEIYPEIEEYTKPEPPTYIKLTVAVLNRTLHFLPSKNKDAKIVSLEILKNGLEIIRDWEDELLPVVHQIWSPLVNRFKTDEDHLIFNLSFQLLISLARLSKDFIRLRTVKEILPSILETLHTLSKKSYLKRKGSPYRYTQAYKLQIILLENFARIIVDLEMAPEQMQDCMKVVHLYLSDKQPQPLRTNCFEFFKTLGIYDIDLVRFTVNSLEMDENIKQKLLDFLSE